MAASLHLDVIDSFLSILSRMHRVEKHPRNLPHWYREGSSAIYWITFRLADSLPEAELQSIRVARERFLEAHPKPWPPEISQIYKEQFSDKIEAWLDAGHGACHLVRRDLRQHFVDALLKFDGERHDLIAAVVMPNHVHILIHPREGIDLGKLLGGIKGTSARHIQAALGTTGQSFWMDESYDHIVRSKAELKILLKYIRENPRHLPPDHYWLEEREITQLLTSDPALEILFVK